MTENESRLTKRNSDGSVGINEFRYYNHNDVQKLTRKLADYEDVGTIEEFKDLKEKNEPKKVVYREQNYGTPWLCPECEASQIRVDFMHSDGSEPKEKHSYCWKCGTKIDWQ